MLRPKSPIFFLFLLILSTASVRAADRPSDPPQPDPAVAASASDAAIPPPDESADASVPADVPRPSVNSEEASPAESGGASEEATFSTADGTRDEARGVCKDYGQICRRTKECCAPLRCAFDGYVFYCRY